MSSQDQYGMSGLMGNHVMEPGKWMFTLSHAFMNMAGNRDGNNNLSRAEVHQDFMVAPTRMFMQMSMLGLMVGVNERLSLMGMVPQVRKSMNLQARNGRRFSTRSAGLGDVRLMMILRACEKKNRGHRTGAVHLNAGLSLPTGSIDRKDETPMGRVRLPYPMQLGSGTLDPLLALHYAVFDAAGWGWGAHASALFRFGHNSNGYRLGHNYHADLWLGRQLHPRLSLTARLAGQVWGDVHGRDRRLNPAMVPTARTDLRGGEQADLVFNIKWKNRSPRFGMNRFLLEAGVPVYQNLDGPQLRSRYRGKVSWQHMF